MMRSSSPSISITSAIYPESSTFSLTSKSFHLRFIDKRVEPSSSKQPSSRSSVPRVSKKEHGCDMGL